MYIQNKFKIKGLAMLEALVAITIIMTAILAPMSVIIASIKFSEAGIKRIQATYLTVDGAELTYNYRKTLNIFCFQNPEYAFCNNGPNGDLSISSFMQFVEEITNEKGTGVATCTKTNPCVFDINSFLSTTSPTVSTNFLDKSSFCDFLKINPISKTFSCNVGDATIFYRYMYAEKIDSNNFSDNTDAGPSGLLITNVACFDRTVAQCRDSLDFKNKVIVKNYVSK